jgi:Tol biopolymer transport system component
MRNRLMTLADVLLAVLLIATPVLAGQVRQITDNKDVSYDWPMPIGDGSEIFVASSTNQYAGGGNTEHRFQISSVDPVTGVATQISSFPASLSHVRHNLTVTDDGQWLAFISSGDLVPGQNGDRSDEAFAMKRDGTSLTQLTHISGPNAGSVTRIAMSGASNRVAFVTSANINGGNPQRAQQLYVIDRDGANLIQLTNAPTGSIGHMWISDDGTRLAFNHDGDLTGGNADKNEEVFAITVGDALPRQITSSTAGHADSANISGDGNTIVFESTANYTGGNTDGSDEIFIANFTTGAITRLTSFPTTLKASRQPWPTNDGSTIYFSSNRFNVNFYEIWKIASNGTGLIRLTDLSLDAQHPVVSGDGSRFGTWLDGALYTGTSAGIGTETPLIVRDVPVLGYLDLSANGQKVTFISPLDPFGSNPDHARQLFVSNVDGTGLRQLTFAVPGEFVIRPAINGDGSRIYFETNSDPLGLNNDRNGEVFGINSDGTGLTQYTNCNDLGNGIWSGYAEVSDDGNTIVFLSLCDLTGGNPPAASPRAPLFKIDRFGNNLTQLVSFPAAGGNLTTYTYYPRLDATGTWVSFTGNANINGGNPENNYEAWRMKTDGTNLVQITSSATFNTFWSDISGDGTKVVFHYTGDPLGTNADHNNEVFLYQPGAVPALRQLTATTKGDQAYPRFSRDGHYVYFQSDSELLENDPDHTFRALYRYDLTTSTLERSGGLRFENLGVAVASLTQSAASYPHEVNNDGSVVAYTTFSDSIGKNLDEYYEFMTLDYNAPNPPVISPHAAPTTVTFAPEPGLVRYDVIRGDLANLHNAGSTVDLGAVACIENDSGDTTTVGYPDVVTPLPGQGFYYVFRGSMSIGTGPGSYGAGTAGERVAGSGDCTP